MNAPDPFALGGDEDEPATAEQLAAIEFEPLPLEAAAAMDRDFSANRWTDECLDHGIALRFAYAVLTKTKEKLVENVEQVERDFPPPAPSGYAEVLNAFKSSRERFETLAAILKSAETRQLSAASVVELRLLGGAKPETRHYPLTSRKILP